MHKHHRLTTTLSKKKKKEEERNHTSDLPPQYNSVQHHMKTFNNGNSEDWLKLLDRIDMCIGK